MTSDVLKVLKTTSPHKRQIIIAAAVICLIGTIFLWQEVIKDRVIPKNFGVVEEGRIYRSGQISPSLIKKVLLKYQIKEIISLSGNSSDEEIKIAEELGIKRVVFSLRGNGTGDVNDYAKIVAEICQAQKEKKPVLIHCVAGAQRTGGAIAAYRLIIQHKDVNSVRVEMIHYGFDPDDDTNLRNFLNNNMMKIAEKLKKMGVIDTMPSLIPKI
jgi:protein tyrosine/serine phosphatase